MRFCTDQQAQQVKGHLPPSSVAAQYLAAHQSELARQGSSSLDTHPTSLGCLCSPSALALPGLTQGSCGMVPAVCVPLHVPFPIILLADRLHCGTVGCCVQLQQELTGKNPLDKGVVKEAAETKVKGKAGPLPTSAYCNSIRASCARNKCTRPCTCTQLFLLYTQ